MGHTGFTVGFLFLSMVYVVLVVVGSYAVGLYWKAYMQMKKTKMIMSVFLLLLSLLIENVYFLATSIGVGFEHTIGTFLQIPWLWAIPKLFMLGAIIYFIHASLSPAENGQKNGLKNIGGKTP